MDLARTISQTPLPTIFVMGGILFWILAIAGSVAGKITIEPGMRLTAELAGTAFIILGLILFFVAPNPTSQVSAEGTQKAASATTASPAPAPGPAPGPAPPSNPSPAPVPGPAPAPRTPSHTRPSPGVNCTGTATPDEAVICGDVKLIDLDWQLHDLYFAILNGLDKAQQTKLMHDESGWVTLRGSCKSDTNCLTKAYQLRIDQLKSMR